MENLSFDKESVIQSKNSKEPKKKLPWWSVVFTIAVPIGGFFYGYYNGEDGTTKAPLNSSNEQSQIMLPEESGKPIAPAPSTSNIPSHPAQTLLPPESQKPVVPFPKTLDTGWEKAVKSIASTKSMPAHKYDAVMQLAAKNHGKQEVTGFVTNLTTDFLDDSYLDKPNDEFSMLPQAYKARSVEKQGMEIRKSGFKDEKQEAIYDFASDYLQNIKYVYIGVDSVNSQSVKSNEGQMRKALDVVTK